MGGRLWRQQPHRRRSGGAGKPRSLRQHGRLRRRSSTIARCPIRSWVSRSPAAARAGAWRRDWAAARAMPSRPASMERRAPVPPTSPRRSPSPITGCRPTVSPSPAIISPRASTRRVLARGWKAAIASRPSTAALHPTPRSRRRASATPSYGETDTNGGGFALAYAARTATDTRSELGARFDRLLAFNPTPVLALRARLAWAHDWVRRSGARPRLPGASRRELRRQRRNPARGLRPGLGRRGASPFANGVSLLGKFDGEFATRSLTYAGTGTVRYVW